VCGWERVTEDIPPTFNLTGYDRSKNSIDMILNLTIQNNLNAQDFKTK